MATLKKELGLVDVFAISTGAMFSSGFFLLPGVAAAGTGPSVILAYMLAGIFIMPAMLSVAELSTAMPRSGGAYYFLDRALGPLVGTSLYKIAPYAPMLCGGILMTIISVYAFTIVTPKPHPEPAS